MGRREVAQTLFEKYGGFSTYRKVVSSFYDQILDSPSLQKYFTGVDMGKLIDHQTKFVAYITGGPASFSDENLARAHKSLQITEEEFEEMIEIFQDTLEDFDLEPEDVAYLVKELRNRSHLIV